MIIADHVVVLVLLVAYLDLVIIHRGQLRAHLPGHPGASLGYLCPLDATLNMNIGQLGVRQFAVSGTGWNG